MVAQAAVVVQMTSPKHNQGVAKLYRKPQAAEAAARVPEQAVAAKAAQQRQRLAALTTLLMTGRTGLHLPRPHPGEGVMVGCFPMAATLVEMAALAEGLDQKAQRVKTESLKMTPKPVLAVKAEIPAHLLTETAL